MDAVGLGSKNEKEPPHEGHHLITIIFLIAVLVAIVFLIPPSIVPLPQATVSQPQPAPQQPSVPVPVIDYESPFVRNSFEVSREHNFGLFETKLLRMGFYTFYNNISKKEETKFRADIWVRNAGNAAEDFNTFNGFIRQPPNQYNVTGGTFNGEDISPGEVREGHILFETVPRDLKGDISISIGTALSYNSIFGIQSQFPFLYELNYPGH